MTKVEKLILDEGWQRGQQDGWQKGRQDERCEGIRTLIASLRSLSIPEDVIVNQLVERYQLNKGEANEFLVQK